ncbi:hypothetical protein ACO2FA_13445 [Staphylococcus warneri]
MKWCPSFNIKALDGLFDRSVSTDGQNLGLIRYLTKQTGYYLQEKLLLLVLVI